MIHSNFFCRSCQCPTAEWLRAKKSLNIESFSVTLPGSTRCHHSVIRFITPQMSWSFSDWNLGRGLALIYWCRRSCLCSFTWKFHLQKGFYLSRTSLVFVYWLECWIFREFNLRRRLFLLWEPGGTVSGARSHSAVIFAECLLKEIKTKQLRLIIRGIHLSKDYKSAIPSRANLKASPEAAAVVASKSALVYSLLSSDNHRHTVKIARRHKKPEILRHYLAIIKYIAFSRVRTKRKTSLCLLLINVSENK